MTPRARHNHRTERIPLLYGWGALLASRFVPSAQRDNQHARNCRQFMHRDILVNHEQTIPSHVGGPRRPTCMHQETHTTKSKHALSPQELMSRFGEHVTARALDALAALYEPAAVFVPKPRVVLSGRTAIASALEELLALSPVMETHVREVHQADDIALVIVDWNLRGTAPDGSAVTQSGRSSDVLRRQSDGTWRVLIDHP